MFTVHTAGQLIRMDAQIAYRLCQAFADCGICAPFDSTVSRPYSVVE